MFSNMVKELAMGLQPDTGSLAKRFDAAMIKKLAVVRLPPSLWSRDPKINPRADHLFWAALLIGDRQRIDLAISAIAAELDEKSKNKPGALKTDLAAAVQGLAADLLDVMGDPPSRQKVEREIHEFLPEYFRGREA